MGVLGNTKTDLIRHDYKRACYRAMLSDFSEAEVKEYFTSIPLAISGKEIKGKDLFNLLWSDKAQVPICWDLAMDNALEKFCVLKGKNPVEILNKVLWLNNQSTYIPGKVLLTWFYPKLESLFDSVDSRDMVFPLVTLFTENYLPGYLHRRIKKWEEGDWIKSIQVFISDPEFGEYLEWDYEFIAGPQIIHGPGMMGMPPFEKFGMLADTRLPERIVWEESDLPICEDGRMLIRGEVVALRTSFAGFCAKREIDLSRFNPPDLDVWEMSVDYHCPCRNRITLHRGCVYGAPLFLNTVEHRRIALQNRAVLANFVADIAREEIDTDALMSKHRDLLASFAGPSAFVYHTSDESLTLNGSYFTKGIPAKIMKSLMESYTSIGKQDFEYREFKRDFEISMGQKNANFEVRFYRLVDKLKADSQGVRIEKTGRGRFRLTVDGEFSYREMV